MMIAVQHFPRSCEKLTWHLCRYVRYETNLEELRRLRKESRVLKGKKGLAESAIIRRIHFIYERATRKFRGDLRLWSAWLEFCKASNSKRRLSQVTITPYCTLKPGQCQKRPSCLLMVPGSGMYPLYAP